MRFARLPIVSLVTLPVLAVLLAGPGAAHDEHDPRHQAMESLSDSMEALVRLVRGTFDAGEAQTRAGVIAEVAERMPDLFENRNPGENNNRAKPEIWDDWDGFSARIDQFRAASAELVAAAESGEAAAVGAALNGVGQSCSGCHRPYRAPKR